jgi:hypothetical protein
VIDDGRDGGARRDEDVHVEGRAKHRQAQFAKMPRAYLQLANVLILEAGALIYSILSEAKLAASSGQGLHQLFVGSAPYSDSQDLTSQSLSARSLRN